MAKLSSDKKYVTVEAGDTLGQIASDYAGGYSNYKQLQTINDIANANLITIGQKIYLTSSGSTSSSSSSNSNKATNLQLGLQAKPVTNTLLATWKWSKSNTDKYQLEWQYYTKDKVWFTGDDGDTKYKYSTFSIPDNATKVRFRVKPISKEKKSSNSTTTQYHWKAEWTDRKEFNVDKSLPPEAPAQPSIDPDGYSITVSLDNIDSDADKIHFALYKNNANTAYKTKDVTIKTASASHTWTNLPAGCEFKVRAKAIRDSLESAWSQYSGNESTPPSALKSISTLKALSNTSVQLTWKSVSVADSYKIEYTTKKIYFDTSSEVSSTTVIHPTTTAVINNLTSGEEYFFRLRVVNDKGESEWSEIKSIIIGKPPAAPTTWSSVTTAIVGEPLTLYWVHNTEDGSPQTLAEIELTVDGEVIEPTITIRTDPPANEDEEEEALAKTHSYPVTTTNYPAGTKFEWRVRTMGILGAYGDWSIKRVVDIYAPPTLEIGVFKDQQYIDTVDSFPFYIYGLAGPETQAPTGYHVEILANETYETVDHIGNYVYISEGDAVYSKYFDTSDALMLEMSASNIDLENGMEYTVKVTVSMNSGLSVTDTYTFNVSWGENQHIPNAEIGIDENNYSALIRPYCEDVITHYYVVSKNGSRYTKTAEEIDYIVGEEVNRAVTTTGETVYLGMTAEGVETYFCENTTSTLTEGVTLSVYRREYDGKFTEIATGLNNTDSTFCTDPHPALDYARYRIVATDTDTGEVGYYDIPGIPVMCSSIIVQWDEEWSEFNDPGYEDPLAEPSWTGSLLVLPYNVDVTDSNSADVSLVNYIGREHPVSYYGTHLGETSTWNTSIPKEDKETIYALRRLAKWMGDVYVREPSGTGYWTHVSVSFNQKHRELTVPVTFNITRVEGGM